MDFPVTLIDLVGLIALFLWGPSAEGVGQCRVNRNPNDTAVPESRTSVPTTGKPLRWPVKPTV